MKKYLQILTLAAIAGISGAHAAPATDVEPAAATRTLSFQSGIYLAKSGKLAINIQKPRTAGMILTIRDAHNNIVHSQRIPADTDKLGLRLDIRELRDGDYNVELISGKEKTIRKIRLSTFENIADRELKIG